MKLVRPLLIGIAVVAVLSAVAISIAFSSGFQTWVARRVLASQPGLKGTVGSVSAGLHQVEVKDARIERNGAVFTLPSAVVELPVLKAVLGKKVFVTRLVAKGWVIDLSGATPSAVKKTVGNVNRRSREFSFLTPAFADAGAAPAVAPVFQGIFPQLQLPIELSLDGVELEGDVVLPAMQDRAATRMKLTLRGGGLAAGREGSFVFDLAAAAAAGVAPVSAVSLHGTLSAAMDTSHSFTRLAAKAEAAASGTQFPHGVKLNTDVAANRDAKGENYHVMVIGEGRELAALHAEFPFAADKSSAGAKLTGAWKLDVHDADLVPFALGVPLPAFESMGEGSFDADPSLSEIHAGGKINVVADKLETVRPELVAMGQVHLSAAFDLAQRGDVIRVDQLSVDLSGAKPVATVRALQAFEFNAATTDLKVADPTQDLLGVSVQGVPLSWATPFLPGFALTGGDLKGELVVNARDGKVALRSKNPFVIAGLSLQRAGKPLLHEVDASLTTSADYTAQGWQVVVAPLAVKGGDTTLFSLEGKAGRRARKDQPVKVTGILSLNLPGALAQPVLGSAAQLTGGDASVDFAASLGARQEIQAKLAVANLAADPKLVAEKLPGITADIRADREPDGKITIGVPLVVERDGRKSDLSFSGTLVPEKTGLTLDAHIASALLVVEDVKILAAPLGSSSSPSTAPAAEEKGRKPDTAPPWAGITGKVALALKKVVYSDSFEAADVNGTLQLEAGALKLSGLRAGLGDSSEAKVSGGLTFDAKAAAPYSLAADLAVSEFDPAPLFRALNPGQPATVEGKFNVTSKLSGRASRLADLATDTGGDFQLTSKGGVFRGLPVSVAQKAELTSKLAAGVASLGNLATALTGKSDKNLADITSAAQAVAELTKFWSAISYDQLSVVLARDASLNTVLKDFTLIAPEIRLTGGGQATHKPGAPLLDEALAMEFNLRARGHQADLLKYLGKIDSHADDLGYFGCTLPIKVAGTLGKPDTSELTHALEAVVMEKTGMTDKASELLNKLFGK